MKFNRTKNENKIHKALIMMKKKTMFNQKKIG